MPAGVEWRGIPFPRGWTHWRLRTALRRDRPDVTFIPSHVLPLGLQLPSVVTIHDVGHRRERAGYSAAAWWYLELTTRYAVRRATHLIAVSQSTADDLQRIYQATPGRMTVIHSGVDPRMRPQTGTRIAEVLRRLGVGQPYFLFVGRNHPRKNLAMLRRAFATARRQGLQASLVLAGPDQVAGLPGDHIVALPYVAEDELPALYAGAVALLLPSRFEGFGFPALEAMGCGTPVIASTAGSLPEIVDGAAILLSPDDEAGWTRAMLDIADDASERQRLVEAGAARHSGFTWESAARQTWDVLEKAAAQRRATAS